MNGSDLGAALLESAWLSARIAAAISLAASLGAVLIVHAQAHAGASRSVAPRVRPSGSGLRLAAMVTALAGSAAATWLGRGQVAAWFVPPVQALAAATAALACLSGAMLAIWAAATLGPNFAVGASVRGDERAALVTTGPFVLLRHPLYAALGLMAAGATLAWGSIVGLAWVLLAYPLTARLRADLEEQALAEAWPEAWPAYAARTPRFLPRM